jgi:dipeptidyl-peptidase 4
MKKYLVILTNLLILLPILATTQEKALTINDASFMNRAIMPKSMPGLSWMGNTPYLAYTEEKEMFSMKAGVSKPLFLFSLDDLNSSLKKIDADTLRRLPSFNWTDDESGYFIAQSRVYLYHLSSKQIQELNHFPPEAANVDVEKNTRSVAYTIDNNLYVAIQGRQVQLTNDKDPGIVNGQTVHRNEFGISKGTYWSPGGSYLAFYRKDETMVSDYPLVDTDKRVATLNSIKYPMAGMASHEVTLGVFDATTGEIIYLDTGAPADQYLTCVTWSPDEKQIYVALLNREQDHMKLNCYDTRNGKLLKTLFEEISDKYVEPMNGPAFLNENPEQFIWISERDGYRHLYLYNTAGELLQQLTSGPWVVRSLSGISPDDKYAYFTATTESPLNADVYRVEIKSGEITKIAERSGTHNIRLNENGKYFIDIFSDTLTAREYSVISTRGKLLQILQENEDPLAAYHTGNMSIFTIDANDGTELYCRMITPPGFDPAGQYPAIVYVYGGPHAQLVTNSWLGGASLFLYYLAQEGYVVFTLDNRGSANRGREFEQTIFRRLGTVETEDQLTGVEYLKSLPFIDGARLGVHGWSYGGFMTITLMLKKADIFKVGVCGGPVTDWKYYEVMYGERYMDTPETNPEGYEASSLLNHVGKLQGKLLIIHGTADPVVVWQHSLALISKFISTGRQPDYFVYPGHGHGVGGKDRIHLNERMAQYFFDNL